MLEPEGYASRPALGLRLRCSRFVQFEPIPAVSEWGMVAVTLAVLTLGTLVFMRRRSARESVE